MNLPIPTVETNRLPVLALREGVLLPGISLAAGARRESSFHAIEAALKDHDSQILVVPQRVASVERPVLEDLYHVGTRGKISHAMRLPDGTLRVRLEGDERIALDELLTDEPFLLGRYSLAPLETSDTEAPNYEAHRREVSELALRALSLLPDGVPAELVATLQSDGVVAVAYALVAILGADPEVQRAVLLADRSESILEELLPFLRREVKVLEMRSELRDKVREGSRELEREHLLRQELRAIREELGEKAESRAEAEGLRERIAEAALPDAVRQDVERELERLESMGPTSPEHGSLSTWIEFLADLPWGRESDAWIDVPRAEAVLDADHHGLEEVKERILEYLSVFERNPQAKTPILCLVGPPGVGKTSLGRSLARALGRKFARLSLGGLHDESELRGHRRTYIGAQPGRVLTTLKRAGVSNPLILLDEIDKIGRDYRGDPTAALLEILDPEQNHTFRDNYLGHAFDLSRVFFLATANQLDTLPPPLLDRMEIIRIAGYRDDEKREIARRYLIPARLREIGIGQIPAEASGPEKPGEPGEPAPADPPEPAPVEPTPDPIEPMPDPIEPTPDPSEPGPEPFRGAVTDADLEALAGWRLSDEALAFLIRRYTREAGVRGLERQIAKLARKIVYRQARDEIVPEVLEIDDVTELLGAPPVPAEKRRRVLEPGVAQGLAWTPTGGELLPIEALRLPEGGGLTLTGQLGDVMKESVQAARSWVWANAKELGIDPAVFTDSGLHVHVPAGAIPKDGPSAGMAMALTLASLLLDRPLRRDTAMTGELSLSGLVLPVGGIREKLLAARRAGVGRVVLPAENRREAEEVPEELRKDLELIFVEHIREAIPEVFSCCPLRPVLQTA